MPSEAMGGTGVLTKDGLDATEVIFTCWSLVTPAPIRPMRHVVIWGEAAGGMTKTAAGEADVLA